LALALVLAASASASASAGLVTLPDGRRIYMECRGSGSPTVILESGAGNGGDIWSFRHPGSHKPEVLPAVACFTRVCTYDRPGTSLQDGAPSRSDPVPQPRTVAQDVAELHDLLVAAHIRPPYVLAGHSFGGMILRLFAGTYPHQLRGFVSIDAAEEIYYGAYLALLAPEEINQPGLEVSVQSAAAEMWQARVDKPLRPMPMIVLEHSRDRRRVPNPFGLPPDSPILQLEQAFEASQNDLASLVPHTRHIIATKSGHYIQLKQPELVIGSVRSVVGQARRGARRAAAR
jgi:pimeloyl-ACP methyl ester carboxylesterase